MLSRYRIGDVASAVFADQFGCWGFLDVWRGDTREPFSDADADFITSLVAPLTKALRRSQARTFLQPAAPQRHQAGPVVLTLDDDLRITSRTAASQAWLNVLLPPDPDEKAIPASVYNVAAQLIAAEEGVDTHPASARAHLADGFWLTLRAARLSAGEQEPGSAASGVLVVTIEEASAAERLELFGRAFGLSAREYELLGLLATGSDTRGDGIARCRYRSTPSRTTSSRSSPRPQASDRITLLSRALGTRRTAGSAARTVSDGHG